MSGATRWCRHLTGDNSKLRGHTQKMLAPSELLIYLTLSDKAFKGFLMQANLGLREGVPKCTDDTGVILSTIVTTAMLEVCS